MLSCHSKFLNNVTLYIIIYDKTKLDNDIVNHYVVVHSNFSPLYVVVHSNFSFE
jgi:hypothetical protein